MGINAKLSIPILDYTSKTPATVYDSQTVYLDDDGTRHLVQDGDSLLLPYTYDLQSMLLHTM